MKTLKFKTWLRIAFLEALSHNYKDNQKILKNKSTNLNPKVWPLKDVRAKISYSIDFFKISPADR